MAMIIKMAAFWYVTARSLVDIDRLPPSSGFQYYDDGGSRQL
jgi:hypothetical protein